MADPQSTSTRLCGVCGQSALRKYCGETCAKAAFIAKRATGGTCADCQKPCRRGARRCSPCHLAWNARTNRGADGRFPTLLTKRSCRLCFGEFQPRDAKTVYCSRECAFTDPNWKQEHWEKLAIARVERVAQWKRHREALRRTCVSCGLEFPCATRRGRTCSAKCLKAIANKAAISHYRRTRRPNPGICRCRECGTEFEPVYPSKHRSFCSADCLETYSNRISRAQRRARMLEAIREPVDPIAVCERDGWRCQLCGVSTPRRLRGTHVDNAPEMDHIIPLALGGSHTYANVQCSCRRCNSIKGARPLGQLRLA
jgi:5-methylcytosine-specific restriction endonuclease McrA